MSIEEAIEILKRDRDLANFNPMSGECTPMNEDCKQSVEAYDIILKELKHKADKRKFIVELSIDWCDDSLELIFFDIVSEVSCCWHHFVVESVQEISCEKINPN